METKKIFRSRTSRMLCGVCGGIGEYFGIDATIVRLLALILSLSNVAFAVVIYFIAAFVIPEEA